MSDLVVRRWTRYGKDRLYVSTADGAAVGWCDLRTGAVTVQAAERAVEIEAALAAWEAAVPVQAAPPAAEVVANPSSATLLEPVATAPEQAWRNLALNRPGQAAREQAERELAAMRERTRIGAFIARAFDMKTDERAWRVGAGGEETVGARLEKLVDHGWKVLHSVPVGRRGSDIDHVLIGPGGVYTINTKRHPGKKVWVSPHQIRVAGQPTAYLRTSRFEGQRAEQKLTAAVGFPVFVRPVLVFLTGTLVPDVTIKQPPEDVLVLDRMDIPRAFKRLPQRLASDAVDAIYEYARRDVTWLG